MARVGRSCVVCTAAYPSSARSRARPDGFGRGDVVEEDAVAVTHRHGGDEHLVTEAIEAGEVTLDVLPGQESRHRDRAAEEIVRDGYDVRVHAARDQRREPALEARSVERSGHDGDLAQRSRRTDAPKRAAELVLEAAHQADAVLGHGESLVGVGLGERGLGLEIDLVGGEDEATTQRREAALLPLLDRHHEASSLIRGQQSELGQPLAVPREPNRHDGRGRHVRMQSLEIDDRALEVPAVVPVGAQHDLGVHPDPGSGESFHPRQDLGTVSRAAEERVAERRIGRMYRDVERRQPLRLDALEGRLVQVGQRDVVAVQERQPEVVVLDVEALAQAARILMDEAEDALVGARRDVARPRRNELEAEVTPLAGHLNAAGVVVALDGQPQPIVGRVELEVDGIAERRAVDGDDPVTRVEPGHGRRRAPPHRGNDDPLGAAVTRGTGWTHAPRARRCARCSGNASPARCTGVRRPP